MLGKLWHPLFFIQPLALLRTMLLHLGVLFGVLSSVLSDVVTGESCPATRLIRLVKIDAEPQQEISGFGASGAW